MMVVSGVKEYKKRREVRDHAGVKRRHLYTKNNDATFPTRSAVELLDLLAVGVLQEGVEVVLGRGLVRVPPENHKN